METTTIYFGSLGLFVLSATLIRVASPYSQSSCVAYEKNKKYRLVGQILLIMALFALGIGALSQWVSINR
jgi:hypothetical protein